ncbi:glycosyltransferase [Erwinia sp. CPCC 100877]|nr:glycosyltransferase [Erwinia sp. CPCC 100877]
MKVYLMGKNRQKLLIVSNMYPSPNYPHYGVFVENSKKILEQAGYEIDLAVMHKQNKKWRKVWSYLVFYTQVIYKCLRYNYKTIYVHYASHSALPLLIVNRLKKQKIITNVHGNDVVPESSKDEKFLPLTNKLLKQSAKVISPSTYFSEQLMKNFNVPFEKIFIYPSGGVDETTFFPVEKECALKQFSLNATYTYIGYIGRIEKNKGWDIFLNAAAKIKRVKPDIRFLIAGNGEENDLFNNMVKELHLEKHIIKYDLLPQKEVNYLLNTLAIFCFPTYRRSESLGLIGLEAMAAGTIVIASDEGGPASYINDGINGFLFKNKNYEALVEKILDVLALSEEAQASIKVQSLATAEAYSVKNTKKQLLELFEE